jgi:RNA polymerase sigma-70 factor, ECF subfamily
VDHTGSVTRLLDQLRSDDQRTRAEAAKAIWDRYCNELLSLACQNLNRRLQRRLGPEDVVQGTFASFFFRQQRGKYNLADRNDLLRLLVQMTLNKVRSAAVKESRQRRDYRRDQPVPADDSESDVDWLLEQAKEGVPTPDEAAVFTEEVERRIAMLPEDLRRIALLMLEGYTNEEIAALPEVRRSVRTVERKVKLIQEAWDVRG